MNVKLIVKLGGMIAVLGAVGLAASCERAVGNSAEVISVKATTKTVAVTREECHDQLVTLNREVKDENRVAGTATGAVVGGVIGNQVGGGSGKDIATIGGAIAGGYAGNQVQKGMQDRNTYQEMQQVCSMVNGTEQQPSGYDVTYLLDGEERMIHLDYAPEGRMAVVDGQVVAKQ